MNERTRAFIETIDLGRRTRFAFELLDTADPCFVGLVVALLVLLGARMTSGSPALRRWGVLGGLAFFLLHGLAAWVRVGRPGPEALPLLTARSAIAAGAVLAVFWIALPVLGFVYRYLRLAVAAFLVYAGYALANAETPETESLRLVAWRGLGVAGLAMVVAWVLQPVGQLFRRFLPSRRPRAEPPKTQLPAPALTAPPSGEVILSDNPERRRRDRVRLKVEMNYVLIQPQVGSTLPPTTFKEFLHRYLGDHLSPEEVEENGRELLALLESHSQGGVSREPPATLEGLTRWFLDEQKRLEGLDLDADVKRNRLAGLQQQYAARAGRLLRQDQQG